MFDSLFAGLNSLDISDMDLQSDAEKRHLHAALPCISVDNASYLVDSNLVAEPMARPGLGLRCQRWLLTGCRALLFGLIASMLLITGFELTLSLQFCSRTIRLIEPFEGDGLDVA